MGDIHTCRFGVNYTPSEIWWYCWNDFRPASIARDLDTIAAIGADHIRIMARWPYFQPNPTWVSPAPLERLDQVLALAQERGLDVCVAMLNGHLTGQNFRQGYEGGRSFFSDPLLLAAQRQYFAAVAETIGGRENFLGFDLGNELNCCWCTEDLAEGDRWFGETMDLVERLLPAAVHVNGLDHQPWFRPHTFTPAGQAQRQSIVPLHCWIHFTGALQRGGPTLEPVVRLAEAMTALVRAYAEDPAKPVWVQEYGASEEWMDAAQIPTFLEQATTAAIEGGVAWFTWWASHDIDRKFAVKPLEYSLGLIGVDQHIKPQGEAFRELARSFAGKPARSPAADVSMAPPEHTPEATWEWLLAWMAATRR